MKISAIEGAPPFEETKTHNLTRGEISKGISSIKAEDIEAIGTTLILRVIELMKIEKPEIQIQFMTAALPLVTAKIEHAFSTPDSFLMKGVRLEFIRSKGEDITKQMIIQSRNLLFVDAVIEGSKRLLNSMSTLFRMECVGYCLAIQLHPQYTQQIGQLYFSVTDASSNLGYTLDGFRKGAMN